KAFRVFNKRTRRVEENLHVEFLENKAIEKGLGPNWLFDIDSLTKSMNYVPVDAGTISTNLSGTKDATSQEVKKDVSFLRYIALPNWAHDALLEFPLSKPQDYYSTEVPKDNGNLNPTASTSTPPADQMETLTVETPIPTLGRSYAGRTARLVAQGHTQEEWIDYDEVFAPVARIEAIRLFLAYASFMGFTVYQMNVKSAFLYDTIDEGVEARLISKRVANQEDTASLDNILSLTNRFKDILGVSTSSDETIGVEANVSNMETSISASPTPTLRIHKDHPKS
nr:copia protein [Tanacetum cinerariifolium]